MHHYSIIDLLFIFNSFLLVILHWDRLVLFELLTIYNTLTGVSCNILHVMQIRQQTGAVTSINSFL